MNESLNESLGFKRLQSF